MTTAVVFGLLPALVHVARRTCSACSRRVAAARAAAAAAGRTTCWSPRRLRWRSCCSPAPGCSCASVARLTSEDPGFRPANVVTAGIQLTGGAYGSWPQVEQFHSALVQSLQQQAGVEAAGASNFLPLAPGWRIPFLIRGVPAPPRGDEPTAQYHSVSEGYFETLGVPLLRGRLFDAHDTAQSRGVVVINQALAQRYFGGRRSGR